MNDKKVYLGLAIFFTGMPLVAGDGWPVAIIGLIYFYVYFTHDDRKRNKEIAREKQLKQWEAERTKKENETAVKRDNSTHKVYSTATEKNNSCGNCGSKFNLQQHHILPIQHGGTDDASNLMTLCKGCHEKEHGYEFLEDDFDNARKPLGKSEIVTKAIREKRNLKIRYSSPAFKSKCKPPHYSNKDNEFFSEIV